MNNPGIIVITGPTATGKTALGVALAQKMNTEVISADSMQIYRHMDIGTAKPLPEETQGVPHHMIDVAEPTEDFSVARWVEEAAACADKLIARGKVPLVVGGTGLYIDSLLAGRSFSAAPGDTGVRERLGAEYDALGGAAMLAKLAAVDPERAGKLAPADKRRIVRALEVYELTGETITEHDKRTKLLPPRYPSVRFALTFRDRETLYERIDKRVDLMEEMGLFEEVERLLAQGLTARHTAMQAIGYKEIVAALRGECTRQEAPDKVKMESRRYAKRQLTWLRRDAGIHWLCREDCPTTPEALEQICRILRQE